MTRHIDRRTVLKTFGASVLGGTILTGTAAASDDPTISRVPITALPPLTNPCNQEDITPTEGTFQLVTHSHMDSGGGLHAIVEGNTQGAKGEGSFGNDYALEAGIWHEHNDPSGPPSTFTTTATVHAISHGSAPNFVANLAAHMTMNADGDLSVEFEKLNTRCQG